MGQLQHNKFRHGGNELTDRINSVYNYSPVSEQPLDNIMMRFLTSITFSKGGLNRAIFFLKENVSLRGNIGIGPSSSEQAKKIWGKIEGEWNCENLVQANFIMLEKDYADLNNFIRGLRIGVTSRDADENLAIINPIEYAFKTGKARIVDGFSEKEDNEFAKIKFTLEMGEHSKKEGCEPIAIVPIKLQGEVLGVVIGDVAFEPDRKLEQKDLELMRVIAGYLENDIGNKINTMKLEERMQEDRQRIRDEEAINSIITSKTLEIMERKVVEFFAGKEEISCANIYVLTDNGNVLKCVDVEGKDAKLVEEFKLIRETEKPQKVFVELDAGSNCIEVPPDDPGRDNGISELRRDMEIVHIPLKTERGPLGVITFASEKKVPQSIINRAVYLARIVAPNMEMKLLERQRDMLNDQLQQKVGELAIALKNERYMAKRVVSVQEGVEHNLRNLFTAVGGFAKRMEKTDNPEKIKKYSGYILGGISKLEKLLERLSDYIRVVTMEYENEKFNIMHAIDSSAKDMEGGERKITINVPNLEVVGDREQVVYGFKEIIENSIRHGEGEITIYGEVDGDFVQITIVDEGSGIPDPDENAKKMFMPFSDVGAFVDENVGFGGAIFDRIIRMNGGQVGVLCSEDGGCAVWGTLPLAKAQASE